MTTTADLNKAFIESIEKGDVSVIKKLLRAGAETATHEYEGTRQDGTYSDGTKRYQSTTANAPLDRAVRKGDVNIVKLLLDAGAPDYQGEASGFTLPLETLRAGVHTGNPEIVRLLLGKEVQWWESGTREPHIALVEDTVRTTDSLEIFGLIIACVGESGSALVQAAKSDKPEFVRFLIDWGVDVHFRNDLALAETFEVGNEEIAALLTGAGASAEAAAITRLISTAPGLDKEKVNARADELEERLHEKPRQLRAVLQRVLRIAGHRVDADNRKERDIAVSLLDRLSRLPTVKPDPEIYKAHGSSYDFYDHILDAKQAKVLFDEIEFGDEESVRELLISGTVPTLNDSRFLVKAVERDDLGIFKLLFDAGAGAASLKAPLEKAIELKRDNIVTFLENAGEASQLRSLARSTQIESDTKTLWNAVKGHDYGETIRLVGTLEKNFSDDPGKLTGVLRKVFAKAAIDADDKKIASFALERLARVSRTGLAPG